MSSRESTKTADLQSTHTRLAASKPRPRRAREDSCELLQGLRLCSSSTFLAWLDRGDTVTASTSKPPLRQVVGIGASAGGLEALRDLVGGLRGGAGAAYLVAQHQAPAQHSRLVQLLATCTELPVRAGVEGAQLEPDTITVAPPDHDLEVEGDQLRLPPPAPRFGPSPGIDRLFESIAGQWGERGAAVVLSGTGSDGACGLRAVRAAGGLTLVQTPASARFDAMPRAAIGLGGAELILEAGAIGQRLGRLIGAIEPTDAPAQDPPPTLMAALIRELQRASGIDFTLYKPTTLRRQVQRRMAIRETASLDDYLALLAAEEPEARALAQNLLVTVTSFFRDPEAFAALREALRPCLAQRGSDEQLRVWVPGCATGEEVYSIAMLVSELLDHPADLTRELKIFATDLDEASLAIGRRATYPLAAAAAIPAGLRRRFVVERSGEMQISDGLRSCAVFARHNVAEDPPFANLDLISCRNTLIYFTTPLQERVLSLFRFGLLPGGVLFLGNSESLGSRIQGFSVINPEQRLYLRTAEPRGRILAPLSQAQQRHGHGSGPLMLRPTLPRDAVPDQHVALLEALVRGLNQPALVLDENHALVEVVGDVQAFCQLPQGQINSAAHAFLRAELQTAARALLLLVRADGTPVDSEPIALEQPPLSLRLEARPLPVQERQLTLLRFLIEPEGGAVAGAHCRLADQGVAFEREIERLEQALVANQDSLRRSLTELEEANEELEASAEELQASAEELQSSNEELEASNEELQATNEELATLNQQLRRRSEQLELLNTDLENIQNSLSQGMVIVDRDLRVTRFSALAVRVFALVESDLGQPLLGVPTTLPLLGLREALQAVLGGEPRRSLEAGNEDVGYLVQVLPYQERDGRRRGAIVTLTDVSELVGLRRAAEATLQEFSRLTDALDQAVWKRDRSLGRLLYASRRIHALSGWSPAELCARPELLEEAIAEADRPLVAAARDTSRGHWSVRYRMSTRDGRLIWVQESARVIEAADGFCVVGTLADVTDLHAAEDHGRDMADLFEALFDAGGHGVALLDGRLRVVRANASLCRQVGCDAATIEGVPWPMFTDPADEPKLRQWLEGQRSGGAPEDGKGVGVGLRRRDGSRLLVHLELRPLPRPVGGAELLLIAREGAGGSVDPGE